MRRRVAVAITLMLAACHRAPPAGPRRLLLVTPAGGAVRSGSLTVAGETRPALLDSASYRTELPARGLLTFGIGVAYSGTGEAAGWYRVRVRQGDQILFERTINPRVPAGWRDVGLPLPARAGGLSFDLELVDRQGHPLARPPDLLLGLADPTIHDLDAYGAAKGVLLVSIDTVRRDHVGAYGYPRPTTPRFDALAREGVLCEDAVSTSSWTLPAHLSLLTSADPASHGGTDMRHGFNHALPTLAAVLRKAGFATHAVTSHLYVSSVYGLDDGFESLDFHQDRKATDVADRAIALLDRFGDRPFFVFLHFYDPHWHYDPPPQTRRIFEHPYAGTITGLWQDFSQRDAAHVSPADLQHLIDLYDGEIRYADDELGRVLDHLRLRGLERGTLVVVVSDHGEEFLDHGSWEHQKTLYEEVVRVPMAMRGPGIGARRERSQVSLLDVAPTILAWTGVPPPPQRGRSLLAPVAPREAYGETEHTLDGTRKLFLRGGGGSWKTILSLPRDRDDIPVREEWYDLAADPGEHHDARPSPERVADLRRRALGRFVEDRGRAAAAPEVRLTPEQRERLRALGYIIP